MENNQEHKIDKIFKKSLENQPIIPPTDAWMGIHTYTIGQEEKKPKVWLKYASLAMLLLLISGFGVWYIVDNQKHTSNLVMQKVVNEDSDNFGRSSVGTQTTVQVVSEDTDHHKTTAFDNAGRVLNPASVKKPNQLVQVSRISFTNKTKEKTQDLKFQGVVFQTPAIENQVFIVEDNLTNKNIEPVTYLTENNLEIIESKPLILNDLIDKIQKGNGNKIVVLEENMVDKKEVSKVDSVDYGGKFSLRHPIISYGLGATRSFWGFGTFLGIGGNSLSRTKNLPPYYIANGNIIKIGVAWKVNKKLRIGISLSNESYNLGIPYQGVEEKNNIITSKIYLSKESFGKYYIGTTPFGIINVPATWFFDAPTDIPNSMDSIRNVIYRTPHRMNVSVLSITSQFDILSKNRKKGKKLGYQIYGLSDFIIQRQTGYSYTFIDEKTNLKSIQTTQKEIFGDNLIGGGHLNDGTEYTLGLRIGLGFRYQFAKKWDIYFEGSGQSNFNSWIKRAEINQHSISMQAGINLNL